MEAADAPVVVFRRWAKSPRRRAAYPKLTLIDWQSWWAKALRFSRSSKRASMSLASLSAASGSGEAEVPLTADALWVAAELPPPRKRLKMDGSDEDLDVELALDPL